MVRVSKINIGSYNAKQLPPPPLPNSPLKIETSTSSHLPINFNTNIIRKFSFY